MILMWQSGQICSLYLGKNSDKKLENKVDELMDLIVKTRRKQDIQQLVSNLIRKEDLQDVLIMNLC